MKIVSLQLSNILSFKYVDDVGNAERIKFDDDLNIIIGENGSGKSTALEVINFVFKRILFKQYHLNQDLYDQRGSISAEQRRQIILPANNNSFNGFRLDPNWSSEGAPQRIRIEIKLDEIDKNNIRYLQENQNIIYPWGNKYSTRGMIDLSGYGEFYTLDVTLNSQGKTFTVQPHGCSLDFGYDYLTDYNFYKETISLYNLENSDNRINALYESFTLISSYRNYHAFNTSVNLRDQTPATQIQQIRNADYQRSLNANDNSEPTIFTLVRLRVADEHFSRMSEKMSEDEREKAANELSFIIEINKRLRIVNLACKIKLLDLRTWQYRFEFIDLRRGKALADINSLSAGQKAITHLVFEAYGRGDLKGGLVIIDEPEIHLHYQFQHEYLQVIRDLNKYQSCQYILVTHSEALINSTTINSVKRFSLNSDGNTIIKFPTLNTAQKLLIRILDNTRSTYAFFAKKVVLVEGDSDRFFFKAVVQSLHQDLNQEIAILHVGGKNELNQWTALFESFGLTVFRISDFDYVLNIFYPDEPKLKLNTSIASSTFKSTHPDCDDKITAEYNRNTFILRNGDLEHYLNISKNLTEVISFCDNLLQGYLQNESDPNSVEIRNIVQRIVSA